MNLLEKKAQELKKSNKEHFNKNKDKISCLFVANKFIELNNLRKNKNSFHFGIRRLQKLVLLAEICYMQIHNKPLFEEDWENYAEVNGLAVHEMYAYFANRSGEITNTRKIWYPPYYKLPQKEYEKKIDKKLNEELNRIVEEIYNITEFVDSVDLINMLRVDFPEFLSVPKYYDGMGGDFPIDKQIIYNQFKDFDFNALKELNEKERVNWVV